MTATYIWVMLGVQAFSLAWYAYATAFGPGLGTGELRVVAGWILFQAAIAPFVLVAAVLLGLRALFWVTSDEQ